MGASFLNIFYTIFSDPKYLFGIFSANDVNELKDLIEEDIYWKKGIWINYDIYPWIQAF